MPATDLPSPCTRACTLDPATDVCFGYYRTLDEIMSWTNYSVEEKGNVLKNAKQRKHERDLKFGKPSAPATDTKKTS